MNCNYSFVYLILYFMGGCISNGEKYRVEGQIDNVPGDKVYLFKAVNFEVPVDSAKVKDGRFVFDDFSALGIVEPEVATLSYKDAGGRFRPFLFYNHIKSKNSKMVYKDASFIVENTLIKIYGDFNNNDGLHIEAGKENEIFFSDESFGLLNGNKPRPAVNPQNVNDPERKEYVSKIIEKISDNPHSYFLLKSIYNYRILYSYEELDQIVRCFDPKLLQSENGVKLVKSVSKLRQTQSGALLYDVELKTPNGTDKSPLHSKSALNMLVVWASWCTPCISEIPMLKELEERYTRKGLSISSISVDDDVDAWKSALLKYPMNWDQYWVKRDSATQAGKLFDFYTIPVVLFVDSEGIEIQRFIGFDENSRQEYINFIESRLLK